jgi:opacity protein-like surface antigen
VRTLAAFLLFATLAVAADAPVLTDGESLAIRDSQLAEANLRLKMADLYNQYNQTQAQLTEQQTKTRALLTTARAKGGDGYMFDDVTLKFTAKPKPEAAKK